MEASGRPDAPVVSGVMPVHNAGVHLSGAIESVLAQTFRDFELILVDDGATDGSGGLCDEYAVKDSRVRVKHGRNGGINAGLAMARGKWVAFCDHDDFMEPDLLEVALGAVEGTGHKLVKFDHATFRRLGDGTLRREYAGFGRGDCEWTAQEVLTAEGYPFFKALAGLVWDGLYLREFIEACGLRFDESFKFGGEDFDFMTRCIAAAGGGVWTARILYRHYYNVGVSTSSSFHLALVFDYLRTAHAERRLFPAAFSDAGVMRNAPTQLMEELGYADGYKYAHDFPGNFVDQEFMPKAFEGKVFYEPQQNKHEDTLKAYLLRCWPKYYNKG